MKIEHGIKMEIKLRPWTLSDLDNLVRYANNWNVAKNLTDKFPFDRVFARPFGTNIPSRKVLEKNNFILEGKFEQVLIKDNQLLDELVYATRRDYWKNQKTK